jgi:hypothetical protein
MSPPATKPPYAGHRFPADALNRMPGLGRPEYVRTA